jgi:RNA polymerase sigma factor (sigma-70 family)
VFKQAFSLEVSYLCRSKLLTLVAARQLDLPINFVGGRAASAYRWVRVPPNFDSLQLMKQSGGLAAVFMANRSALQRFLRARFRGAVDSDDILQDLWIKIESLDAGPVAEPLAYIYRMAQNLVHDRKRSVLRQNLRDSEWTKVQIDGGLHAAVDNIPSAERQLFARDHLRFVDAVLDGLPERTAFAFRSARIEGMPQKEIAATMGISVSAVEKHLQKAYRAVLAIHTELEAENLRLDQPKMGEHSRDR